MSKHKKLISFNSEKHPEVARFFNELEDTNLTSHYVREAIKFYEQYKTQVTTTINVPIVENRVVEQLTNEQSNKEKEENGKKKETLEVESEGKFESFDPNEIF